MALYGDLTYDSRVRKEARSLSEAGYDVVVVCLASGGTGDGPARRASASSICRPPESSVIPGAPEPVLRVAAVAARLRPGDG